MCLLLYFHIYLLLYYSQTEVSAVVCLHVSAVVYAQAHVSAVVRSHIYVCAIVYIHVYIYILYTLVS